MWLGLEFLRSAAHWLLKKINKLNYNQRPAVKSDMLNCKAVSWLPIFKSLSGWRQSQSYYYYLNTHAQFNALALPVFIFDDNFWSANTAQKIDQKWKPWQILSLSGRSNNKYYHCPSTAVRVWKVEAECRNQEHSIELRWSNDIYGSNYHREKLEKYDYSKL